MTDHSQSPDTSETTTTTYESVTDTSTGKRSWRRLPSGRNAIAAGAVVAGLAIGGVGFGAGYAVGDDGAATTGTSQTTDNGFGDRGMPDGGPGGDTGGQTGGQMGGQMGGPPGDTTQGQGGTTGEAPDFDGDGEPDSGSDPSSQSGSGSDTQQS